MAGKQNYNQQYNPLWEDYFFAFIANSTVCLLCGYQPTVVKKYVIEKHYKRKHSDEYVQYVGHEKSNLIEGLKLVYAESCTAIPNVIDGISSKCALAASYAISHRIAKQSKPFTEGNFIKECIIDAVKSFGNTLTLEQAASIPLTDKTVTSRVNAISTSIEETLRTLFATCTYFSLCLDESTDNRHVSQLSIFARIVHNDFSCAEELVDLVPLHGTTTGVDIYKAVEETLHKFNIDWSKCSAVVTDGAKAMTGSKTGFVGQLKQRNLTFPILHCIIHQEALCGKNIKLCVAMQTVTKIINLIKGGNKFLTHRKFQTFLQEHKAAYTDIPLYCEVRWLSAAQCLQTFFAIRKEIFLFLEEMPISRSDEFKSLSEDFDFLCELAVITDMANHLNGLNLRLQTSNQHVSQLVSHIDAFRRKLLLLHAHLEGDILYHYPSCKILLDEYGPICDFKKHLHFIDSLITQFNTRFSDLEILRKDLMLFENPLTASIEEQKLELQEELCALQHDLSVKSRPETGIQFYRLLNTSHYPQLIQFSLRIYSMFGSTYLCECSFSKMKYIKTDRRSSLKDASLASLMRISTSTIQPDISSLTSNKRARISSKS